MKRQQIENLSIQNNGILKTSDAIELGISKQYFHEFVTKNGYKMLSRGVYLAPNSWEDGMYSLQNRYTKAIFSYETALYLLGLSEREPLQYEVTVPQGYNATKIKQQNVNVYTVKPEWYNIGIIEYFTPMNNTIKTYSAERTLCDIFKGTCKIEIQAKQYAVKEYLRRNNKNIPLLMEYAKTLKVEKQLKQYLEVLL